MQLFSDKANFKPLIIGGIILLAFMVGFKAGDRDKRDYTSPDRSEPIAAKTDPRDLELTGSNAHLVGAGDLIEVDITFKNTGQRPISDREASVLIYRSDGSFYKSSKLHIIFSNESLSPGEIGTKEFIVDNPENLKTFKFQAVIH
jgi:hypothetical protein